MRQQILQLYQQHPRHWCQLLKRNTDVWNQLLQATAQLPESTSVKNRALHVLHGSAVCAQGQTRTQGDVIAGWRHCGRAGSCACARAQVAASVSAAAQSKTPAEQALTQQRRQQTVLQRYGVHNVGQTAQARTAHQQFYADAEQVAQQLQKQQATLQRKYQVSNVREIPGVSEKISATCESRWGAANAMQNPEVARRSAAQRQLRWDPEQLMQRNQQRFVQQLQQRWAVTCTSPAADYQGVATRPLMQFKCCTCGHEFQKRFDYAAPPVCKQCHPSQTSYISAEELSVLSWIQQVYAGPVISGDRSIIAPWQLDIVLPDARLALEYCGLYWHSELSAGRHWQYHAHKHQLCAAQGYQLITLFSDEWLLKTEIVKSQLLHRLGLQTQSVPARACELVSVPVDQARAFADQHHIQGAPGRLSVCVGLQHQGQLLALSCWRRRQAQHWELTRLCSSTRVQGGASRMLAAFVREYAPASIVSFSDNRWSQGHMYQQLGFVQQGQVPPVQHYVENYSKRHHKLAFRRSRIVQPSENVTEWQRMQQLGFDRIWDCGKLRWVWQPAA